MMIVLYILLALFAVMGLMASIKKPQSVYKNEPTQRNPMEGKTVRFVCVPSEPENADGVCGHLEAVGTANGKRSFYDRVVKRMLDVILSFCGLVILSPVFLVDRKSVV